MKTKLLYSHAKGTGKKQAQSHVQKCLPWELMLSFTQLLIFFKVLPRLQNLVNFDNLKQTEEERFANFRLDMMKNFKMPESEMDVN